MKSKTGEETAESLIRTPDGRRKIVENAQDEGVRVTLDGHPAVIRGFQLKFATVSRLDLVSSHEWSWMAVWRTLHRPKNRGEFSS